MLEAISVIKLTGLPALARENTGMLSKFESQIMNTLFFLL